MRPLTVGIFAINPTQAKTRQFIRTALRWGLRLGVAWAIGALLLAAAIFIYSRTDRAEASDVIIVLGAGLMRDNSPGWALTRRTIKAHTLWEQGFAGQIICTGGYGPGRLRSEAEACAELLINRGIPAEVIHLEDRSHSTEENALYAKEIMEALGWQSAVVVSDGFHLLRAHWIFNGVGIQNTTSPAPDPTRSFHLYSLGREVAALHWLAFKNVFNIPLTHLFIHQS